jgi:glyoxylase-like metal-dependent hydrolase (beta-lactamase superfamily II)
MTLDGTNTWLLVDTEGHRAVVVDPGPDLSEHHGAVLAALERVEARAELILLTHGHADHAAGAGRLAELAGGIPVRALDPAHRLGSEGLSEGDRVRVGGLDVHVVGTPGHTADSLSFHLVADAAVLTGDTVLGRGTSFVAHPDGRLADYLDSLRRLAHLAQTYELTQVLPGHGPALPDPARVIARYEDHRLERLEQVRRAVEEGASGAREVVEMVYAEVDHSLWPAAELSVKAQLLYLRENNN